MGLPSDPAHLDHPTTLTSEPGSRTRLATTENMYHKHCLGRAKRFMKDAPHPNHGPSTLLPSGRLYRSLRSHTSRLRKSFFPEAVTLLNSTPQHYCTHYCTVSILLYLPCPFLHRPKLSCCSHYYYSSCTYNQLYIVYVY